MKFTNGYWHIRKEITPLYAVEYMEHRIKGNELTVFMPCREVDDRAKCIDLPMLSIILSSPRENIIKVSLAHHRGAPNRGPHGKISSTDPKVTVLDEDETLTYASGTLKAVIDKRPASWSLSFYEDDRLLTRTSWKNMSHMVNNETGRCYTVEQLALGVGEYVYGLGERFTPFVRNGQSVDMWNEDGGTASEISYKNIPFYLSNRGYGVLVDNEGDVRFEIGSEKVECVQFSAEGQHLEYYFIAGTTPLGTVQKYTELTGKPALPPAWSFGLWLTTSFTTDYDEKTVNSFIQGMEDRDIPLHVFHFDCYWMKAAEWCNFEWDPETFPDPRGMLARLKERGLKICVWINPYIAEKSPLFAEGAESGFFLRKQDGSVFQTDFWQPGMAYVDFTSPEAVSWYCGKLKALLDMGVDCFKTDFGERIPVKDIVYSDGSDPVKMHNYYTFLYNKAVFELLEKERGKGDAALFARSATVGGQQFPVHWGGDCWATFDAMSETLRGGLSLALGGFGFWSHDIGGFEKTADPALYKRWCAFGLLSSHSRLHGSTSYRVPWLFDEEAVDVLRHFVKQKCRLMPYLYGQAVKAHEEGLPMHRPLFAAFPGDRACETLDRQYMLGDSLLVAPVLSKEGVVEYYLPRGTWTRYGGGEVLEGGSWRKETHDFFGLPLLVKENSILPIGRCDDRPDYDYTRDLTLYLSEFGEGGSAGITIPDLAGNAALTVRAKRTGGTIEVTLDGEAPGWNCLLLSGKTECLEKTDRKMVLKI